MSGPIWTGHLNREQVKVRYSDPHYAIANKNQQKTRTGKPTAEKAFRSQAYVANFGVNYININIESWGDIQQA